MDVISGILARDFSIRPQGNTAPMVASKTGSTHKSTFYPPGPATHPPSYNYFFNSTASSATANSKSTVNQPHDPILDTFNKGPVFDTPVYEDDIFGSVPGVKSSSNMRFNDDVFGSGPSDRSHVESPPTYDDLLGSFGSASGRVDQNHAASPPPYDDLLGGLVTGERKDDHDQESVKTKGPDISGFEDLLPGFSSSVRPPQPNREAHETHLPKPPKPAPSVQDDPFAVFTTVTSTSSVPSSGLFSDPLDKFTPSASASGPTKVDSSPTTDNFEMPRSQAGHRSIGSDSFSRNKRLVEDPSPESSENSETGEDVWLIVSEIPLFTRPTSAPPPSWPPPPLAIKPKPRQNYSFNKDSSPVDDPEDFAMGKPHPQKFEYDEGDMERSSAAMKDSMNKAEAKFWHAKEVREKMRSKEAEQQEREKADAHERAAADREAREKATAAAAMEREREREAREKARRDREQRTKERVQNALQEMNERDLQAQREQAERHRIAESLDFEITRWAAGKEGNLRALLSSLHYILWQESGWQPVSLTYLINGADVKKVYRKATLCIHPDKVQQATLQQKYIAEKVFDILKEAWNKFNSEELF